MSVHLLFGFRVISKFLSRFRSKKDRRNCTIARYFMIWGFSRYWVHFDIDIGKDYKSKGYFRVSIFPPNLKLNFVFSHVFSKS